MSIPELINVSERPRRAAAVRARRGGAQARGGRSALAACLRKGLRICWFKPVRSSQLLLQKPHENRFKDAANLLISCAGISQTMLRCALTGHGEA